ncbi:MAG: hypothetical protein ACRDVG_10670 [Jatrophihabitantaceae bacterium]
MTLLLVTIGAMVVAAAALCAAMFRRDDGMLGLAALGMAMAAAVMAVVYGGLDSL